MAPATMDHLTPVQLDSFALGSLLDPEASAVEDHLAVCPDCATRLSERSIDDSLVRLLRTSAPTMLLHGSGEAEGSPRADAGGYELLELIGRGGMGVVFKARQPGLGRIVALKQVREGLDASPEALERFRVEVEAVARLQHPAIVPIFEVGRRDGVPFFAMEYLPGGSLADRLDRGPLQPRKAAALVESLALGIEHAHGAGVVHRDLKPANVLMAGDGSPRISDFGLARRLDDQSGRTRTGAVLGTPGYMAPEQAAGLAELVGPRADVYALGSIFYECLTGRPPFQAASPLETLEQVRTLDPTSPRRLQPGIPRDLETICLKCLEKEPRRRYQTAADLAADLARFRDGLPIRARPVGPTERLLKWTRRSPALAALALLAVFMLLAGAAGLFAHNARLRRQIGLTETAAASALAQRERADANYRKARDAIRRMLGWFQDERFARTPRLSELQRAQLEDALAFYEAVLGPGSGPEEPVVELDTARALTEAATLQIALGRPVEAERNLTRALAMTRALDEPLDGSSDLLGLRLDAANKLGLLRAPDRLTEAVEVQGEAVALARLLVQREPDSPERRETLAWCEHNLASSYLLAGRQVEAEAPLRRALAIEETLLASQPEREAFRIEIAESLCNLGLLDVGSGRPDKADAEYRRADEILRAVPRNSPTITRVLLSRSDVLLNWGNLGNASNLIDEATARYDEGVRLAEEALLLEPSWPRARTTVLKLHGARAQLRSKLGRHVQEAVDWARVVEMAEGTQRTFFQTARALALARAGDHVAAARAAQEARRDLEDPAPPDQLYNLACVYGLCAGAARDNDRMPTETRLPLADSHRDSALELLRRCALAGYFHDPGHAAFARTDTDLGVLAGLPEFADLLNPAGPTRLETDGRSR